MLYVTFKNVGQGDSIIIEWLKDGENEIAIVDCKSINSVNPVLEYIVTNRINNIRYLFLTHPHLDHISGFNELLVYCIENNIKVSHFFHTCNSAPASWFNGVTGRMGETEVYKLFQSIRSAMTHLDMKCNFILADSMFDEVKLTKDLVIKWLAPRTTELDKYAANIVQTPSEDESGNVPSANWLSTVFKVYANDWYILLTSDVEKSVLKELGIKRPELFKEKLVLAQAPHHGSFRNYSNSFWKLRNRGNMTPIVFSVGTNSYGHPSKKVVESFIRNNYKVYSTNTPNDFSLIDEVAVKNSMFLDFISTPDPKVLNSGDKKFLILNDGKVSIQ